MNKKLRVFGVMTLLMGMFASGCGLLAGAPAGQAAPANNQPAQQAGQPAQNLAPACQTASSCAAPAVEDTLGVNTFCVQKIPYQNISLDPGVTFEPMDPSGELKCQDTKTVVNGKTIITCTGKQLWTYKLKLTDTACGGAGLTTGSSQCAQGQGYDAAQNCCAPISGDGGGSTIINVNIGACPTK
jgi:hypothetical protein